MCDRGIDITSVYDFSIALFFLFFHFHHYFIDQTEESEVKSEVLHIVCGYYTHYVCEAVYSLCLAVVNVLHFE